MNYEKELNDFEKALGLTKSQLDRVKSAIEDAYNQQWHKDGPNADQINAAVAPFLDTPEEAFYAATVIMSVIFTAMSK